MLYACDGAWWDVHIAAVRRSFGGECWTQDSEAAKRHALRYVRGVGKPGLGRQDIHWGASSGYQAINLAYLWGARRILLLGFDCQMTGGKRHWFGNHPQQLTQEQPFDGWKRHFDNLARDLKAEGVEVINCSRQTALACFAKKPIDECLQERHA